MSAESPKRVARALPSIVPPEPVSDRSIIENVTGFINEVTLSVPPINEKEQIQWVRFETSADISNPCFGEDYDLETGIPPPLLLILGYGNGIQIWSIPANGEATEVLSWRHGIVRCIKMLPTPIASYAIDNANEPNDLYAQKRPLMAICESSQMTSTGPQFCTMNIISLRDGDSVKSIKFKTPILEIAANHQSVVVSFAEKIAVFDARTFEDRLTITTCYPSPGLSSNPIALGSRWLAYAERKLVPSKRSAGGCDCDGVSSYTATVLNAAKTLGKGLRELGEQVAAGFTGTSTSGANSVNMASNTAVGSEAEQMNSGIVTVLDIKHAIKETSPAGTPLTTNGNDPFVAHFVAHTDVVVSMTFDASGLMLLTADKRGHDFHVFRIHTHPCGSASASVHHLYILHRGDTTAKVQDMVFSLDSRWIAVTTARGTTHVFAVSPYGGPTTYRTHGSAEVVNRLSRFHRSAGLSADGRSSSPILHTESGSISSDPYHNNRLPPFPRPQVVMPLKQLRQPFLLSGNLQSTSTPASISNTTQRQRHSSVSDDSGNVFKVCAIFGRARDWLIQPINTSRDMPALRNQQNAADSLFVMAGHGSMIQYDLEPIYASGIPTPRQNDDSPIELHVEAKAQWSLLRKDISIEILPPLASDNYLLKNRMETLETATDDSSDIDERWLSQVEIVTSSGPHRRLWMGPQFIFKTYNTPSGSTLQHIDSESVEVGVNCPANRPARSNPMQMPAISLGRGDVPVLIEAGSLSSYGSPRFMQEYQDELTVMPADTQLREDLADAMRESPRDSGLSPTKQSSISTLASSARTAISIAKRVNPLGTVTTITEAPRESILATNEFEEEYSSGLYIHENRDESSFRYIISGTIDGETDVVHEKPEPIGQKLIVPVIEVSQMPQSKQRLSDIERQQAENVVKFEEMRLMNRSQDDDKKETKRKSNENKAEKARGKENSPKGLKNVAKSDSSDQPEKIEDKPAERKISPEKKVEKVEKDHIEEPEVVSVNVKLKKKASKNAVKIDEPPIKSDEKKEMKTERQNVKTEVPAVEMTIEKKTVAVVEKSEPAPSPPKSGKSKKMSFVDSSSTSKESSVEKEMSPVVVVAQEGTKSKNKKQTNKKLLIESTADNMSSSESSKGDTNTELDLDESNMVEFKINDEFSLLDQIGDVDTVQCAAIQESLLKNSVTVRSVEASVQEEEIFARPTGKSGKKKKSSKESIDNEPIDVVMDDINVSTYQETFESSADLDNLSFKSSIDDQTAMAKLETPQTDDDTAPIATDNSDCSNFQLVIDVPEPYVQISEQNSSDETEDSSQSKSVRSSDKVIDDDDSELQPLICSPTWDTAVDTSKSDSLPNDEPNPIESASTEKTSENPRPQYQKEPFITNHKKKYRKKRR